MSFEEKQTTCSDCWITARDAERERIIKLLEQSLAEYPDAFARHIIALIKGKNK